MKIGRQYEGGRIDTATVETAQPITDLDNVEIDAPDHDILAGHAGHHSSLAGLSAKTGSGAEGLRLPPSSIAIVSV